MKTPDENVILLDASSIDDWQRCPRRFQFRYNHLDSAEPGLGRLFGTAGHLALMHYYKGQPYEQALADFYEKAPALPGAGFRSLTFLNEVLTRYKTRYQVESCETFRLADGQLAVELPFAFHLCDIGDFSIVYCGKVDRITVHEDGTLWNMDHKFISVESKDLWAEYELSQAQLGYVVAAQHAAKLPIRGYEMNIIIYREETRSGKGTEFKRQTYFTEPANLDRWRTNTVAICEDIVAHMHRTEYPMHSHGCVERYGRCDFFEVCRLCDPDAQQRLLNSTMFTKNTWTPLAPAI